MKKLLTLLLAVLLLAGCAGNKSGTFEAGKNTFLLNGKPFVVKAAEVHYPRIPREYWEHRIPADVAVLMVYLKQREGK